MRITFQLLRSKFLGSKEKKTPQTSYIFIHINSIGGMECKKTLYLGDKSQRSKAR